MEMATRNYMIIRTTINHHFQPQNIYLLLLHKVTHRTKTNQQRLKSLSYIRVGKLKFVSVTQISPRVPKMDPPRISENQDRQSISKGKIELQWDREAEE